jgi:hypothetical protein
MISETVQSIYDYIKSSVNDAANMSNSYLPKDSSAKFPTGLRQHGSDIILKSVYVNIGKVLFRIRRAVPYKHSLPHITLSFLVLTHSTYLSKRDRVHIEAKQNKTPGFCPPAHYTDRAIAACRRSQCRL